MQLPLIPCYALTVEVGDKRTQLVYDVDATSNETAVNELIESEQFMSFSPDTLAEARNRGYRLAKS